MELFRLCTSLLLLMLVSCNDKNTAVIPTAAPAPAVYTFDPFKHNEEHIAEIKKEIKEKLKELNEEQASSVEGNAHVFSEADLLPLRYDEKPDEMSTEDEQIIRQKVKRRLKGKDFIENVYLLKGNAVVVMSRDPGNSMGYNFQYFQLRKLKGEWVISSSSSGIACTKGAVDKGKKWSLFNFGE